MNNFIEKYKISNQLCNKIILHFENSKDIEHLKNEYVDMFQVFRTLDEPLMMDYLYEIQEPIKHYKEKYDLDKITGYWQLDTNIKIQKYNPGQAYGGWHSERGEGDMYLKRLLAFMTYLNDVENGGETEWKFQKYKSKPVQGNTYIWPADFTHRHRGLLSKNTKYIITGWFNFL